MQVQITKIGVSFPRLNNLVSGNLKEVQHTVNDSALLYCYEAQEEHGLVMHLQDFADMSNGMYDLPLTIQQFMDAYN